MLLQEVAPLGPPDLVHVLQHPFHGPELDQELGGRLLADAGNPGDVVGGIPLESDEIGHQRRRDAVALFHGLRVVQLGVGDTSGGSHDVHVLADQLQGVPVPGDDHGVAALRVRLPGERGQDVVRLEAGKRHVDEAERLRQLGEVGPLLGQEVGHGLALRLVLFELGVTEGLLLGVPGHDDRFGPLLGQDLDHHGAEAVEGVGGKPRRGGDGVRQGEEGPIGDVVAVEEEERAAVRAGRGGGRRRHAVYCTARPAPGRRGAPGRKRPGAQTPEAGAPSRPGLRPDRAEGRGPQLRVGTRGRTGSGPARRGSRWPCTHPTRPACSPAGTRRRARPALPA